MIDRICNRHLIAIKTHVFIKTLAKARVVIFILVFRSFLVCLSRTFLGTPVSPINRPKSYKNSVFTLCSKKKP